MKSFCGWGIRDFHFSIFFVLFSFLFLSPLRSYLQEDLDKLLSGEKDMSFADLSGAVIKDFDASEINLEGANLNGSKFYNVNLTNALFNDNDDEDKKGGKCPADLRNATMENVNLSGAFLRRVKMGKANLKSVDLSGADCRNLRAANVILTDVIYDGCDLRNANFNNGKYDLVAIFKAEKTAGLKLLRFSSTDEYTQIDYSSEEEEIDEDADFDDVYDLIDDFDGLSIRFPGFTRPMLGAVNNTLRREIAFLQREEDIFYSQRIRVCQYSSCNAVMPKKIINCDKCCICWDKYKNNQNIAVFSCGHTFCVNCANTTLSTPCYDRRGLKHECPVCRCHIESYKKIKLEDLKQNESLD